jgi:hypothetical protein
MNSGEISKSVFLVTLSGMLYLNLQYFHSGFLGWVFLILFFFIFNGGYKKVLLKIFSFSDTFRTKILAIFLHLFFLSSLWGGMIVFYRLSNIVIAVTFLVSGFLSVGLAVLVERVKPKGSIHSTGAPIEMMAGDKKREVVVESPRNNLWLIVFLSLIVWGFYLLKISQTADIILSPWQTISPKFIYVFFFLFLLLGWLIISRFHTAVLLGLIVTFSFLTHSYLPLTNQYIYGADGWRHLASEERIMTGEKFIPKIFIDGELTLIQKINPGKFSYSQFYGLSVALSKILFFNLMTTTLWLLPLFWSIIFTLLLFEVGRSLGWGESQSLFLCLAGLWPFALQAGGSFSLPVNLGFLFFIFFILLLIKRIKNPRKEQLWFLGVIGTLSVFGYFLYLILFWLSWFGVEILFVINKIKNKVIKISGQVFLFLIFLLAIPVLEIFTGFSLWQFKSDGFFGGLKQLLGSLSGYYLASGPREHLIDAGNIFFYQIPTYGFVNNIFIVWRWWIVILMVGFFMILIYRGIKWLKQTDIIKKWWVIMTAGLFGGYIISRYFLAGENILTRRMDAVLAVLILVIIFDMVGDWLNKKFNKFIFLVILAVATVGSYSLGPLSRTVSADEFTAMEYVYAQQKDQPNYCVVADAYPLLILEYLSTKEIVGGGLPIDANFSQPAQVLLFQSFAKNQSLDFFKEAKKITGSKACIFMTNGDIIDNEEKKFLSSGGQMKKFGNITAWEY